jgi:transketolase C-terminal domain/subunit
MCPVKLVGTGRDREYGHLGFSHWAEDADKALSVFENIDRFIPDTELELDRMWNNWLYSKKPAYINLSRQA